MFRYALGRYLKDDKDAVYKDDEFVVIRDAFPKSKVHLLILARDKTKHLSTEPIKLLRDDKQFYAKCAKIVELMRERVAEEFAKAAGCEISMAKKFVQAGLHASPSMAHLHIHVMSTDMNSPRMKKALHYSSFTTDFFVPFDSIPQLTDESRQLDAKLMEQTALKAELKCHYCSKSFGRSFKKLKDHITEEYNKKWG